MSATECSVASVLDATNSGKIPLNSERTHWLLPADVLRRSTDDIRHRWLRQNRGPIVARLRLHDVSRETEALEMC